MEGDAGADAFATSMQAASISASVVVP